MKPAADRNSVMIYEYYFKIAPADHNRVTQMELATLKIIHEPPRGQDPMMHSVYDVFA